MSLHWVPSRLAKVPPHATVTGVGTMPREALARHAHLDLELPGAS